MTGPERTDRPPSPGGSSASARVPRWSEQQAEAHLRSLELFGMRFGLDRMRRMMTVLGSPQRRYDCIHVVGTNGKTSTTRMVAAIIERHGLRSASYTSPHLISYRERLQVAERELGAGEFARAIARAAWAAERVNRTLAGEDHVTQFELLSAGALWEMAEQQVQVAVVEAGLGGRYDATAVIESRVTALTNVGLEHTRWLGPTLRDIAEEKLAVVRPDTTLTIGAGLAPEAMAVAERVARERRARIVQAPSRAPGFALGARGEFQQRNFALARLAAEAYLRSVGIEPSEQAMRAAASDTAVRGRLQVVSADPLTVLDGAHNPDAVRALGGLARGGRRRAPAGARARGARGQGRRGHALAAARAVRAGVVHGAPERPRAVAGGAAVAGSPDGLRRVECEASPQRALADARAWARAHGAAVLATGSVYLVGDLLATLDGVAGAEESGADRRRSAI